MNARLRGKRTLGRLALTPPFSARTRRQLARRVDVVYYHYVGPSTPWFADFYGDTTLERLDRDLELLGRWFSFAPLEDVVAGRASGSESRPPLAITFDDGFRLGAALELLETHGVRATTFVITDCVGDRDLMWRNKLSAIRALIEEPRLLRAYATLGLGPLASAAALNRASGRWPMERKDELADALWGASGMPPLADFLAEQRPYMGWDELRAWRERGHGVGLHTASHPYCARLDEAAAEVEVAEPAALLRRELGLDWLALSYPFGSRLPARIERELFRRRVVDCALGIDGFAPVGVPPYRLERASAEHQLDYHVFGKALLGRP